MLFFYGTRKAKTKTYHLHEHFCKECNSNDLELKVYEDYGHIMFIPLFPIGNKAVSVHCKACGNPFRLYVLEKEYEKKAKAPIYFYTLTIIISCLILTGIFFGVRNSREDHANILSPAIGDVYEVKSNEANQTGYYYLRVMDIKGDMVALYRNTGTYNRTVSQLQSDDYFQKGDTITYAKSSLKKMYDNDEIISVERGYGNDTRFNDIR